MFDLALLVDALDVGGIANGRVALAVLHHQKAGRVMESSSRHDSDLS